MNKTKQRKLETLLIQLNGIPYLLNPNVWYVINGQTPSWNQFYYHDIENMYNNLFPIYIYKPSTHPSPTRIPACIYASSIHTSVPTILLSQRIVQDGHILHEPNYFVCVKSPHLIYNNHSNSTKLILKLTQFHLT